MAEEFFRGRGFEVEMVNVAGDRAALKRLARLAPGVRTVPVIQLGQEVFLNFEPRYWLDRLKAGR